MPVPLLFEIYYVNFLMQKESFIVIPLMYLLFVIYQSFFPVRGIILIPLFKFSNNSAFIFTIIFFSFHPHLYFRNSIVFLDKYKKQQLNEQ